MRSFLTNSLVVIVTLCVLAALGETTVRVLQHANYLPYYGKQIKTGDKPVKPQRVKRPGEPKYIPSLNPVLFVEFDPADPEVNAQGMRGAILPIDKQKNVYRIAVLGDSVAFGYGLQDAESFPRQLESLLNHSGTGKFEVINFAVNGYGLEAYTEVYRTKARLYKPDLVILSFILNDPASTQAVFSAIGEQMKQNAKLKRIGKYSQLCAWLAESFQKAVDGYQSTALFNDLYFKPENQQQISNHLVALGNELKTDGIPLVAFIFPYFHNMQNYPLTSVHDLIGALMEKAGIRHHDLLEDYRDYDGVSLRLESGDYTHPNAEGQRIAAEAIQKYLKQEKYF